MTNMSAAALPCASPVRIEFNGGQGLQVLPKEVW